MRLLQETLLMSEKVQNSVCIILGHAQAMMHLLARADSNVIQKETLLFFV